MSTLRIRRNRKDRKEILGLIYQDNSGDGGRRGDNMLQLEPHHVRKVDDNYLPLLSFLPATFDLRLLVNRINQVCTSTLPGCP